MFNKTKKATSVSEVCSQFINSLEEIFSAQLEVAAKAKSEVEAATARLETATKEIDNAKTAISNIEKLFGVK